MKKILSIITITTAMSIVNFAFCNDIMVGGHEMTPTKDIIDNAINSAFSKLPSGTIDTLLKPENKNILKNILTYHVISGKYDFNSLEKAITNGNGQANIVTVNGAPLHFKMNGEHNITITDNKNNTANISTYDAYQSNGVIHVIDSVLMSK